MPSAEGSASRGSQERLRVWRQPSCQLPGVARWLHGLLTQPLRRDDRGATAVEYALIATLISVVILAAVATVGARVVTMFTTVANAF
jgi:pilus assembly protein Flp/PilA